MDSQIFFNLSRSFLITTIWFLLIFLSYAPGRKFLRLLKIRELTKLEKTVFSISLGLGFFAFGFFLLGILGLFTIWWMLVWIFLLSLWSRKEIYISFKKFPGVLPSFLQIWRTVNYQGKGLIIILTIIFSMTFLQGLTPPWDEDGLMYHMEAPRRFLEAGRIFLIEEIFQANFPMYPEMLYAIGIGLGLDPLAKLIHLSFGILLILTTFAMGERFLGYGKGWLPAVILIASPMIVMQAQLTYTDLAWSLFSLLSVYSFLLWDESRHYTWLILAGIFSGFAVGTKYLGIGIIGIITLLILLKEWKSPPVNKLKKMLLYGFPILFIGSVWYVKNLVFAGNPIYPFLFGGPGMDRERLELSMVFHNQFGTGKSLIDYILIPVNIFLQNDKFSTFLGQQEIPNPLFLLVCLYPFIQHKSRALNSIFLISISGFVVWMLGSQQTRFLLPIFPLLSIITGLVFYRVSSRIKSDRIKKVIIPGILGGFLIAIFITSLDFFLSIQPFKYAIGSETREQFLYRLGDLSLVNYASSKFIEDELSSNNKVLMLGSRQAYYCKELCIPDSDQSFWPYFYKTSKDITHLNHQLGELGITHLLINNLLISEIIEKSGDLVPDSDKYFVSSFHEESYRYLLFEYIPTCTKEIYRDRYEVIFELIC